MGRNTAGTAYAARVTHRQVAGSTSRGAIGVIVALLLMGLFASSALATQGHTLAGTFGAPNSEADGEFQSGGPNGLAVRQSTGDVFVSDPGHGGGAMPRVERFDASGAYQASIAIDGSAYVGPGALAIDPAGAGTVYVGAVDINTGGGVVLKYTAAGVFQSALNASTSGTTLTNPIALAVDPVDGTVYVNATDTTTQLPVIDKFSNTGTFLSSFDGSNGAPDGALQNIAGLAVDGNHMLYVVDVNLNKVYKYNASGAYQSTVDDGTANGVGVARATANPTTNEVYVLENGAQGGQIARYSAGGAARGDVFGFNQIPAGTGLGVLNSSGVVYVSDAAAGVVDRFAPFAGPTVTTTAASAVTSTTATLHGTINPQGIANTNYHFEYGLDRTYGLGTTDSPVAGSSNVAATGPVTDLLPNTLYHYRLVGTNDAGAVYGNDLTFTTATGPPLLDGNPPLATNITGDSATLTGWVDPRGSDTTYHFDWGATTAYGQTTPPDGPLSGQGTQPVSANLAGLLLPDHTYHFRVSASNGTGGVQNGADQVLYTAPAAAPGATSVTGVTAALTGTVNPHGTPATYVFEYGLDTTYGNTTASQDAGSGDGNQTVTANIARLSPDTTYHLRVIKTDTNTGVTTTGADGTFRTNPAPIPFTGAVAGLTTTHASFSGTYDTHGLGGSYQFLIASTTSAFLAQTAPVQVTDAGSAAGEINNLPPGETYTVRLSVTSSGVTRIGDTVTFSTPAIPAVTPPAPPTANTPANPYGCDAPVLAAYNQHPKPGDTVKIAGTDLGVGGNVQLGNDAVTPTAWSATGFSFVLPDDAAGTLALTVNCGKTSNTIAVAVFKEPSNKITASATAKKGSKSATVKVKVPGPGSISITGGNIASASKHASKAATYSVTVKLSAKAAKSLKKAKSKKLAVTLSVKFTPTGGKSASKSVKVTFKR